ncbi:MAG: hypothetical protein ACI9QQ_002624, partial [Myxococcota bacterium]
ASAQVLGIGWRQGLSEAECEQVFEEARALAESAGDKESLAALLANYGGFRGISLGYTEDYIRYTVEAARIADETDNLALRCGTGAYVIYAYWHGGVVEEVLAVCDALEPLLDGDPYLGADVGGLSPLVGVEYTRQTFKAFRGDPIDIDEHFETSRRLALEHGFPEVAVWARWCQIMIAQQKGETAKVSLWARDARELAGEQRGLTGIAARIGHARALGIEGNAQAHLDLSREALMLIRERRDAGCFEPDALDVLSSAHFGLGEFAEARAAAAEGVALMGARKTYGMGMGAFGPLARAQLALGEPAADIHRTLDEWSAVITYTGIHLYDAELAKLRNLVQEREQ